MISIFHECYGHNHKTMCLCLIQLEILSSVDWIWICMPSDAFTVGDTYQVDTPDVALCQVHAIPSVFALENQ